MTFENRFSLRPGGTRDSGPAIYRRVGRTIGICVPEGAPEFGAWASGNFNLESIRHAGFVAAQIQLQASLRDADPIDSQPGDKSPGYYRVSLRDEGKTARRAEALRAWLRSACLSGTKAIRPSKRLTIILA
jgi:hypothetical protein